MNQWVNNTAGVFGLGAAKASAPTSGVSMGTVIAGTVGAGVAIVAAPAIISTVGFTATGIAAKSTAAWMMSCYGGATTAGGIVATLQTAGATGTILGSSVATTICGSVGAAAGGAVKYLARRRV
ncbi:unnamed protein product [Brassicogethes aeneus]|uniref:Uncharacterized protein n=1 Tax=Brassicogethes aeneus TaxID=1431903 RepID=A0A9P0B6Y6_BRAAE|nr:unnamed protein product [Brassicogethes aeneus]